MPRSEEENQRIRDAQREKILEAAKIVFARKGWSAAMADIAAEAKISQGLAYRYFANKEAIYMELMGEILKSNVLRFEEFKEAEGTPTERMEKLISGMLESRRERIASFGIAVQATTEAAPSVNYLEMMRKMMHDRPDGDQGTKNIREIMAERLKAMSNGDFKGADMRAMMQERFKTFCDHIAQMIKEGQDTGEFARDDPEKLALMVLNNIQSLTQLAMHRQDDYIKYYPYTEIIMRMLKPDRG